MSPADNEYRSWRIENKLLSKGTPILTDEDLRKIPAFPPPGRAGVAAWLGKYVVADDFDFNEINLGRQELMVFGANVWIPRPNAKKKMGLATGVYLESAEIHSMFYMYDVSQIV